jgi:hypothetical protein
MGDIKDTGMNDPPQIGLVSRKCEGANASEMGKHASPRRYFV